MSENKKFGEFVCPKCQKTFFVSTSYNAHLAIHGRNKTGTPRCKKCKTVLNDKTWHKSLQKNQNRMCKACVRGRNQKSYMARKKRIMEAKKKGLK
jgi:hypothetical protein